ncbi:hypothetical protein CDAR_562331 [Caerostris darwini]|uniref:Uncharacterized protein n=1 Tax=Caerostris darwini TaxID=1538125 RepID=A0AAV4X986_9ARAC|nr:hypothetical protein CDAR_562331 [Caerostris darwini]
MQREEEDNEIIYKMQHTRATVASRTATKGGVRFRRKGGFIQAARIVWTDVKQEFHGMLPFLSHTTYLRRIATVAKYLPRFNKASTCKNGVELHGFFSVVLI